MLCAIPTLAQQQGDKFQDGKIPRSGFSLYYRVAGAGRPVLILSGGPGDDCDYMAPVALDVAKSARAILLEQRGTGRSRPSVINQNFINLQNYLEDFEAIRIHLNVERWTVVGHSAGGLLAMYYAAAHPERIDKLVLLDTAPIASEFLRPLDDNILDRLSLTERQQLIALQKSGSTTPETMSAMARLQMGAFFFDRKVGATAVAAMSNAWHADIGRLLGNEITPPGYDLRPRLANFDRPVLVLNGRQDPMDPLMAYETSAALKKSMLKFIDRAGHFPWLEHPTELNDILNSFLK